MTSSRISIAPENVEEVLAPKGSSLVPLVPIETKGSAEAEQAVVGTPVAQKGLDANTTTSPADARSQLEGGETVQLPFTATGNNTLFQQ